LVIRERGEAFLEFRVHGDVGFKLVTVFEHRLSGLFGKISLCPDEEIGFLNNDLKFNEVIGFHQVSVGPLFIHVNRASSFISKHYNTQLSFISIELKARFLGKGKIGHNPSKKCY